jgi:Ser-tRNA(Ala) deacylase AlaX
MKTEQLYLSDSYLKNMNATVLEVYPEAQGKWKVVLSETAFYPMGGGQPTDQGMISSENWQGKVYQVLTKDGEIFHYVEAESIPMIGVEVRGEIDWQRRYHNMRIHSAGHIIDFAIYLLGYSPKYLTPLKADHGKKSTIWYQGVIEHNFKEELEIKANFLVDQNLRFSTQLASYEKLKEKAIYLQPNLPTNKQLRLLELETVGAVADGGTQVHFTKEVGHIQILSIETGEGMTKIRYAIEEDK